MLGLPEYAYWLPAAVATIGVFATYVAHRRHPVGLPGWLAPLAAAQLSALALTVAAGALDWRAGVGLTTPENLIPLLARQILESAELLSSGLFGIAVGAVLSLWLIKRPERGVWRVKQVVGSLSLWGLVAAAVVQAGGYVATHLIVVFILASGHIAVERVRGTASGGQARTVLVLTGVALAAWLFLSGVFDVAVAEWVWHRWGTPVNRSHLLTRHAKDLVCFQHLPYVVASTSVALAAIGWRGRTEQSGPCTRPILVLAMLAFVAAPHFVLADHYQRAAFFVREEVAYDRDPVRNIDDIDLATSSDGWGFGYSRTPLVVVGRETVHVAPQLDLRLHSRELVEWDRLDGTLADELARNKSELKLLGHPFDPLVMLAFDRCTPFSVVADTIETSRRAGLSKFKVMVRRSQQFPGEHALYTWPDAQLPVSLVIGERGVDVLHNGEPLEPEAVCDPDGPTVCIQPGEGPCGGPNYDWKAVHAKLLELSRPNYDLIGIEVEDSVCWQSVVDAMDTARWRVPETSKVDDNELFSASLVTPVRLRPAQSHFPRGSNLSPR